MNYGTYTQYKIQSLVFENVRCFENVPEKTKISKKIESILAFLVFL